MNVFKKKVFCNREFLNYSSVLNIYRTLCTRKYFVRDRTDVCIYTSREFNRKFVMSDTPASCTPGLVTERFFFFFLRPTFVTVPTARLRGPVRHVFPQENPIREVIFRQVVHLFVKKVVESSGENFSLACFASAIQIPVRCLVAINLYYYHFNLFSLIIYILFLRAKVKLRHTNIFVFFFIFA